jgi:hypothetical protein
MEASPPGDASMLSTSCFQKKMMRIESALRQNPPSGHHGYEPEGRVFESLRAHHRINNLQRQSILAPYKTHSKPRLGDADFRADGRRASTRASKNCPGAEKCVFGLRETTMP